MMKSYDNFLNKIVEQLKCLMNSNEIDGFIKMQNEDLDRVKKVRQTAEDLPSASFFTEKNRIYIDGLITFAGEKLAAGEYLVFLQNVGQDSIALGEFSLASDIYRHVIGKFRKKSNYEDIVAYAYYYLGDISSRQALWKESFMYIRKAGTLFARLKDYKGQAMCENLLGVIYGEKGDLEKANQHMESSLEMLAQSEDKLLTASIENNLGILNTINGCLENAYTYYCRALTKFEELNEVRRITEVRHNFGMLFIQKKRYDLALNELAMSISMALRERQLSILGLSYIAKAYILTQQNDFELAGAYADKGMEISYQLNDKLSMADIYKIKGIIHSSKNNYELSENYLLSSLRLNRETGNELNYAETSYELGMLYLKQNRIKDSKKYLNKAYNYYKKIGKSSEMLRIQSLKGESEYQ
ncbi:MAG: tetratricopeptide repeat protein [Ignavibacteriales bacterium]